MNTAERTAWLEERRKGIGATDIASLVRTVIDEVPFQTPLQIWRSKVEPVRDDLDDQVKTVMLMGLATEDLNASLYAKRMAGMDLGNPKGITRHPDRDWECCTLDRITDASYPVELKYTPFFSDKWGEELTDQIPHGYIVQTHWQMDCVAGWLGDPVRYADVSALSGTGEHRVYRVMNDAKLVQMLLDIGGDFWTQFVLTGTPPPDDWRHAATDEVLDACDRVTVGKQIVLEGEAVQLATEYSTLKQIAKETEAEIELRKEKLLALMGDAQKAFAGPFKLSRCQIEGGELVTPKSYTTKPYVKFTLNEMKGMR